jgi:hypothetical protein
LVREQHEFYREVPARGEFLYHTPAITSGSWKLPVITDTVTGCFNAAVTILVNLRFAILASFNTMTQTYCYCRRNYIQ